MRARLTVAALVAVLALSLVACAESDDAPTSEDVTDETTEEMTEEDMTEEDG